MSSKDTFEPKTFAANCFAAGVFRGVGAVAPVVTIDHIGIEWTLPANLMHHTLTENRQHWTLAREDNE